MDGIVWGAVLPRGRPAKCRKAFAAVAVPLCAQPDEGRLFTTDFPIWIQRSSSLNNELLLQIVVELICLVMLYRNPILTFVLVD